MRCLSCILVRLIAVALPFTPALVQAEELKLAAWNMEWLNSDYMTGNAKRNPADYEAIRAIVEQIDADVIAVQEVDGEDAAKRVFDPDKYAFFLAGTNRVQRAGYAIKKELTVTHNPDLVELDVGSVRRGVDITIDVAGQPVRLLSVHLKSGCWGKPLDGQPSDYEDEDEASDCAKLNDQVPVLETWIDARASAGEPFIILGDFNRRFEPSEEFWVEIDDGSPANADLHRVNEGLLSQCNSQFPKFIDHIVFDKLSKDWIEPDTFEEFLYTPFHKDYRVPDHCPISVVIDVP